MALKKHLLWNKWTQLKLTLQSLY